MAVKSFSKDFACKTSNDVRDEMSSIVVAYINRLQFDYCYYLLLLAIEPLSAGTCNEAHSPSTVDTRAQEKANGNNKNNNNNRSHYGKSWHAKISLYCLVAACLPAAAIYKYRLMYSLRAQNIVNWLRPVVYPHRNRLNIQTNHCPYPFSVEFIYRVHNIKNTTKRARTQNTQTGPNGRHKKENNKRLFEAAIG